MKGNRPERPALLLVALIAAAPAGLAAEQADDNLVQAREAAFALLRSGKASQAADAFAGLLERDALDVRAIEGRGLSLLAAQRWRAALAEARQHHERLPDDSRVRSLLGQALFRAGRLDEIGPLLERDASRENAPARTLLVLGRLRLAEGREEQAIRLMERAVAAAPEDRELLYWAGGATNTRAEAVERLERYLAISEGDDPDRIEAARGSVDILRALGEEAVWEAVKRPERVELPLTRIWDTTTGRTQGFVVRVRVGQKGKRVPLLLDSGSPGFYVIQRVARKCGFVPLAERTTFGGGGDRRHRVTRGTFATVEMGGLRFRNALASTSRQELDATGRFHGLLGLSVFNGYRVTLDWKRGRLLLDPPGSSAQGDPYWTVEGQMLVRAELNGADSGLFLFDSGATHSAVNTELAVGLAGAKLGPATVVHGFGGTLSGSRRLEGVELQLQQLSSGRAALNATDFSTRSRLSGVEVSGFLGLDLLGDSVTVLDTDTRRVTLRSGD